MRQIFMSLPFLLIASWGSASSPDPRLGHLEPATASGFPSSEQVNDRMTKLRPEVDKAMKVAPANSNDLSRIVAEKPVVSLPPTPPGRQQGRQGFDLDKIIADYERIQTGNLPSTGKPYELLVLLSFSMPEPIIKTYLEQAARYKATVVFRGTPSGDLMQFTKIQQRLVGLKPKAMPRVDINPNAFKKYDIKRVPSIVLGHTPPGQKLDESGCAPASDYLVMTGEVSIPYALNAFSRSRNSSLLKLVNTVSMSAGERP